MNKTEWLLLIIAMGLFTLALYIITKPVPIAYFSWSTGECSYIIVGDKACNCEDLPVLYKKIWVK